MRSNPQVTADLVTFTEEILNGKFHFLCSVRPSFLGHLDMRSIFVIRHIYTKRHILMKEELLVKETF